MAGVKRIWKCVILRVLSFYLFSIFSIPVIAAPSQPASECKVYFASSLFSLREKIFNHQIVWDLEKNHQLKIFLPQRNGFEYSELYTLLSQSLPPSEVMQAEQVIIYFLDMGYFLRNSHAVVAILDEDLDPGVMIEISYAKLMGKYIIGIRTDTRSPYGPSPKTGIHFFPLFQTDDFVFLNNDTSDQHLTQAEKKIADMIIKKIKSFNENDICSITATNYFVDNPVLENLSKGSDLLFGNMSLEEIKSPAGLKLIVSRYKTHQKELLKLYPRIEIINIDNTEPVSTAPGKSAQP